MYSRKVTVLNKTGLHARPASVFVGTASKFKADVTVNRLDENGEVVNSCPAKSIVFLLTMAISQGTVIELTADGEDGQAAVDALVNLVESGFGER